MNSPNRRPNHSHPRPASKRFPRLVFFLIGLVFTTTASAAEVQQHGLIFERWICDTFFEGYRPPSTTQKWDIPAAINRAHGAVPVNPKAAKYGAPIDLGDALRQFEINEPFILLIGCWQQEGADKRFVTFVAPRIEPGTWRKLFGAVTLADLQRLDAVIKDRSLTPAQARAAAQKIKSAPPFTTSIIVFNPKIDSKTQRRLQCSLSFEDVFRHLAPDAERTPQRQPELWGVAFPHPLESKPRQFAGTPPRHSLETLSTNPLPIAEARKSGSAESP